MPPYGYSNVNAKKMESIALPEKIRCKTCKKLKIVSAFSKKQLSDLRYKILQFGQTGTMGAYIKCRQCTGTQTNEMTCVVCDNTKGLEGFSKAQRRTPDNARCRSCVDEHLAVDPGGEDEEEEDEDEDDSDSDGETNQFGSEHSDVVTDGGDGPVSSGLKEVQLAQLDSLTASEKQKPVSSQAKASVDLMSFSHAKDNAWASSTKGNLDTIDGSVWIQQARKGVTAFTGYDSHGIAHSRLHAPSTAGSERSVKPFAPRSNFAKVKSARFGMGSSPPEKPVPEEDFQGRTIANMSDDEEDEFYTI